MKKLYFLSAITLLIFTTCSCDDKDKDVVIFLPTNDILEQVSVFFESKLPMATESPCFFKSSKEDLFYVINSMKELQAIYSCEEKLPEIDFIQYSLIIGQKRMPNSYYLVSDQKIVELPDVLELNIVAKTLSEEVWPSFSMMYYWGIYPKLPNKKLNVNIEIK